MSEAASSASYARIVLEIMAGRRPYRALIAGRFDDPRLAKAARDYEFLLDGVDLDAIDRYADEIGVERRREIVLECLWSLTDMPLPIPPPLHIRVGRYLGVLRRDESAEKVYPFASREDLRVALEQRGGQLRAELCAAGLSGWCAVLDGEAAAIE